MLRDFIGGKFESNTLQRRIHRHARKCIPGAVHSAEKPRVQHTENSREPVTHEAFIQNSFGNPNRQCGRHLQFVNVV